MPPHPRPTVVSSYSGVGLFCLHTPAEQWWGSGVGLHTLPHGGQQLFRGWPLFASTPARWWSAVIQGLPSTPCPTVVSSYSGVGLFYLPTPAQQSAAVLQGLASFVSTPLPNGGQQSFKGWPLLPPHSRPTVVSSYSGLLFPNHSSCEVLFRDGALPPVGRHDALSTGPGATSTCLGTVFVPSCSPHAPPWNARPNQSHPHAQPSVTPQLLMPTASLTPLPAPLGVGWTPFRSGPGWPMASLAADGNEALPRSG